MPVVGKVAGFLGDIVKKVIEFYANSQLLKDVFSFLQWIIGKVWDVLGWIIDKLKWLFDKVVMPILNGIETVYRFLKGGQPAAAKPVVKTEQSPEDKKQGETTNDTLKRIKDNRK
ncbi:MAG: hypothetical protein FWD66_07230 [Paludibacter sp.]|nr:hypothetical protein [Paludibacter sp.]